MTRACPPFFFFLFSLRCCVMGRNEEDSVSQRFPARSRRLFVSSEAGDGWARSNDACATRSKVETGLPCQRARTSGVRSRRVGEVASRLRQSQLDFGVHPLNSKWITVRFLRAQRIKRNSKKLDTAAPPALLHPIFGRRQSSFPGEMIKRDDGECCTGGCTPAHAIPAWRRRDLFRLNEWERILDIR